MLSDEMTTGSVTSSDTQKRAFAAKSHAWNLQQARFKEAFPEVRPQFPGSKPADFSSIARRSFATYRIWVRKKEELHLRPSLLCTTAWQQIRQRKILQVMRWYRGTMPHRMVCPVSVTQRHLDGSFEWFGRNGGGQP